MIASKKIEPIGVIQEQHGRRTQLLNQWKQMSMRLVLDPLNRIDVSAVPITLLVDGHGVIRYRNPKEADLKTFLAEDYNNDGEDVIVPGGDLLVGDRLAMTGKLDEAISWYSDYIEGAKDGDRKSDVARAHFRLGAAYRMRFDATAQESRLKDFHQAVQHWAQALRLNPNQYIWRRRIQQYGPVLDKPYPFYNWIAEARKAISARGETPVRLIVEPGGAELVGPRKSSRSKQDNTAQATNPDPQGAIRRDKHDLLSVQQTVVRSTNRKQMAARVHIVLQPSVLAQCGWNNEGGPTTVWIEGAPPFKVDKQLFEVGDLKESTSQERRAVEFEVSWTKPSNDATVKGFVLFHVCEKESGTCSYLRKDFEIQL